MLGKIFDSESSQETYKIGIMIGKSLKKGDVLALYGDIGAGKTVLVKGIAKGLNIDSMIKSPTFTIVHEYHSPVIFYHFDMYRMICSYEATDMGFQDYINDDSICVIEWADRILDILPKKRIDIFIDKTDEEGKRKISIKGSLDEDTCI